MQDLPKNTPPMVRFSLKNKGNQSEDTPLRSISQNPNPVFSDTPFTQDELNRVWRNYADTIMDKVHLRNTMINIYPTLKDDNVILVSVFNPGQELKLQEEATSLVEYLREYLQNSTIRMEIEITAENTKQLAYTDAEKFTLMASKNPALETLVNEFRLRLD